MVSPMFPVSHSSVTRSIQSSFLGCPAPSACEVVSLAKSFPGLGVVAIRPSGRSFSGWVAVASFRDRLVAGAFSQAAASQLLGEGCFCVVRPVGRRFRVSVPCLSPQLVAVRLHRVVRLGQFHIAPVFAPVAAQKIKWLDAKDEFCWVYDYHAYTDGAMLKEPRPVWSTTPVDVVNAPIIAEALRLKGYKVQLIH